MDHTDPRYQVLYQLVLDHLRVHQPQHSASDLSEAASIGAEYALQYHAALTCTCCDEGHTCEEARVGARLAVERNHGRLTDRQWRGLHSIATDVLHGAGLIELV